MFLPFEFIRPWHLLWLIFIPIIFIISLKSQKNRHFALRQKLSIATRLIIITILIFIMAGLRIISSSNHLTFFVLVDRSNSIRNEATKAATNSLDYLIKKLSPRDNVGVILFGKEPKLERAPNSPLPLPPFSTVIDSNATDISSAVKLAEALFPAEQHKRILLISDGLENQNSVLEELESLTKSGIEVVSYPVYQPEQEEVLIERVNLPNNLYPKQPFYIKIHAKSTSPQEAKLHIEQDGKTIVNDKIKLPEGKSVFVLPQTAKTESSSYRITLEGEKDNWNTNNHAIGKITVTSPPLLLHVSDNALNIKTNPLVNSLRNAGVNVVNISAKNFPADLSSLLKYDGIILSNVPAFQFREDQLNMMELFVKTLGRGVVMTGGPKSFGAGGYANTPLEKILPVKMAVRAKKNIAEVTVLLLIDKSGSMAETQDGVKKIDMAREAAIALTETLFPTDEVGVIAFDSAAQWVVELQKADKKDKIINSIATLRAGGGTDLYPAMDEANTVLNKGSRTIKHLIILSDGRTEPHDFEKLTNSLSAKNVTITTVAVGVDADLPFLAKLAEEGGGRAYRAHDARLLPQIFTSEIFIASKRMIREVTFQPELNETHPTIAGLPWNNSPSLSGYIVTEPKNEVSIALKGADGDPLLALWQTGNGRAAAFTSDPAGAWGEQFIKWEGYSPFWEQVAKWIMGDNSSGRYFITGRVEGNEGVVYLDTLNDNNIPPPYLTIISPSLKDKEFPLQLNPNGSYLAKFPLDEEGTYTITTGQGKVIHLNYPYSKEYLPSPANIALLALLAQKTGGSVISSPQDIPLGPTKKRGKGLIEIEDTLLKLVLFLFLFDIALRRLYLPWQEWLKGLKEFKLSTEQEKTDSLPSLATDKLFEAKTSVKTRSPETITEASVQATLKGHTQGAKTIAISQKENITTPSTLSSAIQKQAPASKQQTDFQSTLEELKKKKMELRKKSSNHPDPPTQ